jgi:hypothetical protein
MPAKSKVMRPWTATDVRILKGLAQQKFEIEKISKKLNRPVPAVTMQASKLGISFSKIASQAPKTLPATGQRWEIGE